MEDINQEFQTDSTIIDQDIDGVKSGAGKVVPEPAKQEARKPESTRDSLEAEFKKLGKEEKPEEPDDKDVKAEKPEDKQPPKQEKAEVKESVKADGVEQEAKAPKPSEGRRIEAPARFLPQAKELWKNVPNVVAQEWERAERERETEISQYREAKTFRDDLAEYDNRARQSGTTLKQALGQYIGMEDAFRNDPARGLYKREVPSAYAP